MTIQVLQVLLTTTGVMLALLGLMLTVSLKVLGIVKERDESIRRNDKQEFEIQLLKFQIDSLKNTKK